MPISNII